MPKPNVSMDIPQKPAHRRAWVKFQLSLKGLTIAELGRQLGVSRPAINHALIYPNAHLEQGIAEALGVSVEQLFPERFENGRRLHKECPANRKYHHARRNGEVAATS